MCITLVDVRSRIDDAKLSLPSYDDSVEMASRSAPHFHPSG
jgi:hypothetical protein